MTKTFAEYAELKELGINNEFKDYNGITHIIITNDNRIWDYDEYNGIYELRQDEEPFDDRDPIDNYNPES